MEDDIRSAYCKCKDELASLSGERLESVNLNSVQTTGAIWR